MKKLILLSLLALPFIILLTSADAAGGSISDSYDDSSKIDTNNSSGYILSEGQIIADNSFGDGLDGSVNFDTNTNLNTTNSISGRSCADGGDAVNYSATSISGTTITLSSTPSSGCLAIGDEVMLINLQGTSTNYANVGNYEILTITSLSTNTVTLDAVTKYYGNGASDQTNIGTGTTNQRVMLQRIPSYTTATINSGISIYPSAWNGIKGGVLAFKASGGATINGTIHADGYGYRGGAGGTTNNTIGSLGMGGESFCNQYAGGSGSLVWGSGYTALCGGGGGGGSSFNNNSPLTYSGGASTSTGGAGGGGGSAYGEFNYKSYGGPAGGGGYGVAINGASSNNSENGASGSLSGDLKYSTGGRGGMGGTYGDADLTRLFLGSGGGGGGYSYGVGGNAGAAGGIIHIEATTITVTGSISSKGSSGSNSQSVNGTLYAGGGAGGSGGSIRLISNTATLGTNLITATGGSGGASNFSTADSGSSGRIAVSANSITGTSSPSSNTSQTLGYVSSSTIQSINLTPSSPDLSGYSNFTYSLPSKPAGTTATISFSQDGSNWYNSSGTLGGADDLLQGSNGINLSSLGWSGSNFYYKVNFTTNNLVTPVLDNIEVYYGQAVSCSPSPGDSSHIVDTNCSFPNDIIDSVNGSRYLAGLSAGSGSDNTASIAVTSNTLTILANQTVATGSLNLTGGSIAIAEGGVIDLDKPIWLVDADADGYPTNNIGYLQLTAPTDGIRLNEMIEIATDCNDGDYSSINSCCTAVTLYPDADGDGYGVSSGSIFACPQSGYVTNNTDCYDSNSSANPASTTCSTSDRGDGSYDYNCSGSTTTCGTDAYVGITIAGESRCCGPTDNDCCTACGYTCSGVGSQVGCGVTGYAAGAGSNCGSGCTGASYTIRGAVTTRACQ